MRTLFNHSDFKQSKTDEPSCYDCEHAKLTQLTTYTMWHCEKRGMGGTSKSKICEKYEERKEE